MSTTATPESRIVTPEQRSAILAPQFEVVDDQINFDPATGLFHTRHFVNLRRYTWREAMDVCSKLRLGGHDGWYLASIQELMRPVCYDRHDPAIDTDLFPGVTPHWCWSSTVDDEDPHVYAWGVSFTYGSSRLDLQSNGGFALAVRGGQ